MPETLGPHRPRRNLLSGLTDALPEWLKAGNRVLLTSRPYGLETPTAGALSCRRPNLPNCLSRCKKLSFVAGMPPPTRRAPRRRPSGLIAHLGRRRDLDELRANPMLLTALCIKYDEGQRLPQDFYRLYDSVVSQVLHKRYPTEKERDRARLRLSAVALGMHQGDPQQPRVTPEAEISIDEVDRILAALAQTD